MARTVLVDTGFLTAIINPRDEWHSWAMQQGPELPPPWYTCEAVVSETYFVLGQRNADKLSGMLSRGRVRLGFHLETQVEPVLQLMEKYADVPMSLADACLVRMTEIASDPVLLTTDSDFRVYRRHGRQVVPCVAPRR
jgi:uncharacterized protein